MAFGPISRHDDRVAAFDRQDTRPIHIAGADTSFEKVGETQFDRANVLALLSQDHDTVEIGKFVGPACQTERFQNVDVAPRREGAGRVDAAHDRELQAGWCRNGHCNLRDLSAILVRKASGDRLLQLSWEHPLRAQLTDQREGNRSVRQNPDNALEPLLAPNIDLQLVARIDTIWPRVRCDRRSRHLSRCLRWRCSWRLISLPGLSQSRPGCEQHRK